MEFYLYFRNIFHESRLPVGRTLINLESKTKLSFFAPEREVVAAQRKLFQRSQLP